MQISGGSAEDSLWQEGDKNEASGLAQWFPDSCSPLQAASDHVTSSLHRGPGELRATIMGNSGIQFHSEVTSVSVKAYTFLPDRQFCMKASHLAVLPCLILLVSAYFHTQATPHGSLR